jgi:hypothetical protein
MALPESAMYENVEEFVAVFEGAHCYLTPGQRDVLADMATMWANQRIMDSIIQKDQEAPPA